MRPSPVGQRLQPHSPRGRKHVAACLVPPTLWVLALPLPPLQPALQQRLPRLPSLYKHATHYALSCRSMQHGQSRHLVSVWMQFGGGGGEKRHECLGCASVDSAPLVIFDAVKAKGSAAACQMGATQTQWKAESVRKKGPSKRPVHTFEKRTPWGTVTFAERGTGPHNISLPSASACSCVTGTRQLTELVLSTS